IANTGFFVIGPSFIRRLHIRLDHFLTPQRTPRAGKKSWAGSCKVLGQSMALGALIGRPGRSSRRRVGGDGGWRSALLAVLSVMALPVLAGEALGQQDPAATPASAHPKPPEKVVAISGNPAATDFRITATGGA